MKTYSISDTAERFGLEPHTLRFYEREGIVTPSRTKKGIRFYTEENIGQLEIAMCLKNTGMSLKDIKKYFDLCRLGEKTLEARREIFLSQREKVLQEMETLTANLKKIEHKISWYDGLIKESSSR